MAKLSCHRCNKQVYPTDKVGPLKDSTFFHQGCFKCYICGTRLLLKSYCNNRNDINDKEVYCSNHVPIASPHDLAPVKGDLSPNENGHSKSNTNGFRRDAGMDDLRIAHAVKATKVAKPYPKIEHKGANYVIDYDAQTRLELLHRKAEDQLYDEFDQLRAKESEQFEVETREEWERALADFARKYEKGQANQRNKDDLIRQLTIKRDKKLETLHSKRRERERHQTAELVDRQAREMLDLFKAARTEYNHDDYPSTPPPPQPPTCSKRDIYTTTEYFSTIDEVAMYCARSEVTSFTELVRTLTSEARSDVDVARAIYRWITIKNLNTMHFDESVQNDTPMGLLRGIKYGTESYHVLFKRLCSYAGLHCVVIKGFSKSAGYQPGFSFDDHRFRNTWNAVYLDGSWRFVQCNWGARHLVNAKDSSTSAQDMRTDGNLRYEYDDHYFMTDPEEFIYEFFPHDPKWQLLPRPIPLEDFERIPFVRSLFFKYGLSFTDPRLESTLYTDRSGAASIAVRLPSKGGDSLIFHYNLKMFDSDDTTINGLSLKRFVMQSVTDGVVTFRVHAPSTRPLLLDIFANSVSSGHYLTGQPIKFKSVCKFKVICESLQVIMVPLPECASGEWGPAKAERLFGLLPTSHPDAIINAGRYVEIRFRMTRALSEFVAALHRNRTEDRMLQHCTRTQIKGEMVSVFIDFPEDGQYGLDIYTRQNEQLVNDNSLWGRPIKGSYPLPSAVTVFPVTFTAAILCLFLGFAIHCANYDVKEIEIPYNWTNCEGYHCKIRFYLERDWKMGRPISTFYRIRGFPYNHRRFQANECKLQWMGKKSWIEECERFITPEKLLKIIPLNEWWKKNVFNFSKHVDHSDYIDPLTGKYIVPMGAKANSMFNDTFELKYMGNSLQGYGLNISIPLIADGILTRFDKLDYMHDSDPNFHSLFDNTTKPRYWKHPITTLKDGFQNVDFVVWMRPEMNKNFRKIYRFVDPAIEIVSFPRGVLPAGEYELIIENNWGLFNSRICKSFILLHPSWYGNRDVFLHRMFWLVGGVFLIVGVVMLTIHRKKGKSLEEVAKISEDDDSKNK